MPEKKTTEKKPEPAAAKKSSNLVTVEKDGAKVEIKPMHLSAWKSKGYKPVQP